LLQEKKYFENKCGKWEETERRTDRKVFSSGCLSLHFIFSGERGVFVFIDKREPLHTRSKRRVRTGFTAIDTSAWEELKKKALQICLFVWEDSSVRSQKVLTSCATRRVCRILNISKRRLQHYRDISVLTFIQIGHRCYYKREDVEALLAKSNRQ